MSDWSRVDAVLSAAVDQSAVPGVVAAATNGSGALYHGAFGKLGLARSEPMTPDTVFWIGSMTKAITSAAAMRLVGEGMLSLSEPITALLPELRNRSILERFDADGAPRLRPARQHITLKHLLTHTSGFAEDVWHEGIAAYMKRARIPPNATRTYAALDLPLVFEPGERWQYGVSHDWVGRAIERASGSRLDDYVQENVFGPLEMRDTTWGIRDGQRGRLAQLHRRDASGLLSTTEKEHPSAPEFIPGGGGLYSTAADYLAFIRMLLNDGRAGDAQIIRPKIAALMAENHTGEIAVGNIASTMPERSRSMRFMQEARCCWGLGVQINLEPLPTGRSAGSMAWAGLGNTYYWIDRSRDVGGVLLTQILPFGDPAVLRLFAEFEAAIYGALS